MNKLLLIDGNSIMNRVRFRHVALMSVQPMRTKTKMVRMISCKIHGYNNRAVDEQQPLFFIIVRN